MHLHEYQAKAVLRKYGINAPIGYVVSSVEEAEKLVDQHQLSCGVVKIQVHAGGRGNAGGVKIAKDRTALIEAVKALIGMRMVNRQTGPEGVVAQKVLIEPLADIAKEYYLGCIIDRHIGHAVLIASPCGGVDIEETAQSDPDKILMLPIKYEQGLKPFQLTALCKFMGWNHEVAIQGKQLAQALAKAFLSTDATLIEINPLVQTTGGELIALDAKMGIDDNALFRQPALAELNDPTQIDANEAQAKKYDLAYVSLDGTVGCMVNGAGLAMATMDLISHYGGRPSNFLDVGGSATKEKVAEGFKIILKDPKVTAILVNIFGGIMNCATLAEGIVEATKELKPHVPIIVRMEGTNVDWGKSILAQEPELNICVADDLDIAARMAVEAS